MSFIDTVAPEHADAEVRAMYRQLQGKLDYLPNYARLYSHRPEIMQAWSELQTSIARHMDRRRYSLITLAAALAMGSTYCALAHGRKLLKLGLRADELVALIEDRDDSPVSEAERAMLHFVRQVVERPSQIGEPDIAALKALGFTDAEVFDIAAAASARCFFARLADALGALPDESLAQATGALEPLLTVGREAPGKAMREEKDHVPGR